MGADCSCQKDQFKEESANQFYVNGIDSKQQKQTVFDVYKPNQEKLTSLLNERQNHEGIAIVDNRESIGSFADNTFGSRMTIEGYHGETQNGEPHGRGKEVYKNGDEYIGQFSKGLRDGYGIFIKNGHYKYTGNFRNNNIEGFGTMEFQNKSVYKGEFLNGVFHGKGVLIDANRVEQKGVWRNGELIS